MVVGSASNGFAMTHASKPAVGGLRFEVLAEIAVGRSSRVDLCKTTAPAAGQLIAVKRLLPEIASDAALANRFLDEVWMTSALRHPNVVGVAGWGEDEQGAYLAVELVQGVSLARLMKTIVETREEFPERLVVFICASIARGLAAAHELTSDRGDPLGLVHRDLGPGNVLIGFNGDVKIADFGLALAKDRLSHTTAALPVRSVSHLSPEELRGERVDQRADVYSLGVILFEMLVSRPAYTGEDDLELVRAIVGGPVPDPLPYRPKMDKALAELVRKCLDKSPSHRPATARSVASDLDGWLHSHGYREENVEALARFVRRNSMRQMRWFERFVASRESPEIENTALPAPRPRDSFPTKETETTVMESGRKGREALRRTRTSEARGPESDPDRSGIPRLNRDEEEEESDNVTTIAVKKSDLAAPAPAAPATERSAPPTARINEETTSDVIELVTEDSSTEGGPQSFQQRALPTKPALVPKASPAPVTIAAAAEREAEPKRAIPVFGPRPTAPSQTTMDSATMTLPTELLAPEYIAHQVERLKGNAHKKRVEAEQAREEAEEARREAEEAEELARTAGKAVAMAVEALHLAEDSQTSRAAEKLEEALNLVDGPASSIA